MHIGPTNTTTYLPKKRTLQQKHTYADEEEIVGNSPNMPGKTFTDKSMHRNTSAKVSWERVLPTQNRYIGERN